MLRTKFKMRTGWGLSGFEEGAVEAALADDGAEGAGLQFSVERDGDGDGAGALFFLHDAVAPFLADGFKSMGAKQIADGFAGEDFTLGHTPPRTG